MKRISLVLFFLVTFFLIPSRSYALSEVNGLQSSANAQADTQEVKKQRLLCPEDVARGCGCRVVQQDVNTSRGRCIDEDQQCTDGGLTHYSCCICERLVEGDAGKQTAIEGFGDEAAKGFTYETCSAFCVQKFGEGSKPFAQLGAGTFGPSKTAANASVAAAQQGASLCFAPAECAKAGGTLRMQADFHCQNGRGRCLAPEPQIALSYPIGGVNSVKGFRSFVLLLFNYALKISGVAAAVVFVFGGFQYMFGSAFGDIKSGKERMINALVGVVILFASYTILQTINPATLSLDKLNVYMINQDQLISTNFCKDIKAGNGKDDFLFADAGKRPNYTPLAQIPVDSFALKKDDTLCNSQYYGKGFGENRCNGSKCIEVGTGCVSCKSGACPKGTSLQDFSCIKATFVGNIGYKNERYVENIVPIVVCSGALKTGTNDYEGGQAAMFALGTEEKLLKGTEVDAGNQFYKFDVTEDILKQAMTSCNLLGGIQGFVLGIQYNDNEGIIDPIGKAATIGPSNDDMAIVGKSACGGGDLTAYADGTATSYDLTDLKRAVWCGIYDTGTLKGTSNYWSWEEMKKAAGVEGASPDPIVCNFQLSNQNAPSNPVANNKYMAGCTGKQPGTEMNLGDQLLDAPWPCILYPLTPGCWL